MATTDLGKWMITNGGEYNPNTTYEQLTMVLYQNSTYITLRTVTGIIPNNDKINYILMAQGFSANALGDVVAKDTYGVIGDVGGDVSAQNLVDYLTNEVVNNLLKKTSISTVQANSDNTVPSSSLAYAMQQEITKNKEDIATANSNLEELSENTQAGTKTGISAKGNSVVEYDIMFDKRFPKIPEVVATLHSGTTNPNYGYLAPIVWDVTTTGFKLRIANAYSETFAPDVTWIAVVK